MLPRAGRMNGCGGSGERMAVTCVAALALFGCGASSDTTDKAPGSVSAASDQRDARVADPSDDASAPGSSAEKLLESLAGEMILENGHVIGNVDLSGGVGEVLVEPPGMGNGDILLMAKAKKVGANSIVLVLSDPNDGSILGELSLRETVRGRPSGALSLMNEKWDVEVPVIAEIEGPIDYDIRPGDIVDDTHDSPAIGVTRPTYRLRGAAAGSNVKLRAFAGTSASITGIVNASAQGILVKRCKPALDSAAFDRAAPRERETMLAQTWCDVAVPMAGDAWAEGWLPGRLLEPEN